jgi:DNA-binding CsgD family transcriptional regulator
VTQLRILLVIANCQQASGRALAFSITSFYLDSEILRLLARGATTTTIAQQLHVSRTTVNNHVQHILRKLDAHSRLEAIRRAEHAGLL